MKRQPIYNAAATIKNVAVGAHNVGAAKWNVSMINHRMNNVFLLFLE